MLCVCTCFFAKNAVFVYICIDFCSESNTVERKTVYLTMLRACTNQVDDVLVPSNFFHSVHFGQKVRQLVLSSISWKRRQITVIFAILFYWLFTLVVVQKTIFQGAGKETVYLTFSTY